MQVDIKLTIADPPEVVTGLWNAPIEASWVIVGRVWVEPYAGGYRAGWRLFRDPFVATGSTPAEAVANARDSWRRSTYGGE